MCTYPSRALVRVIKAGVIAGLVLGTVHMGAAQTRSTYDNNGNPWPIPGQIEAENFDQGTSADPAYYVQTTDQAPADEYYRASNVSIGVDAILKLADVGWIDPGDWYEYTVNIMQSGYYDINTRYATLDAGEYMRYLIDGNDITGKINTPYTGGWGSDLKGGHKFQVVTVSNVYLTAGQHRLRLFDDTGLQTIDYAYFNLHSGGSGAKNQSIYANQAPYFDNQNDGVTYELGTRFQSDVAGQITAIRYWTGTAETGKHVGTIWDANGNKLATATFSAGTVSGWQTQPLDNGPLNILANTTYTASVNTNGYYVYTDNQNHYPNGESGLQSTITNGDLTALANGGVYGTIGQYPTSTYQTGEYFRDVVFTPAGGTEAVYNGPHNIPGTLQAEDYDTGGQGVGYSVNTGTGKYTGYRSDNDGNVEPTTDTGGGYDIGYTNAGEWLNYTVNVASAGTYAVTFRVASGLSGGTFHLINNGSNVSGMVTVPGTGGWQAFTNVTANVTLPAGAQVIQLYEDTGGYNINYMTFASQGATSTTYSFADISGTGAAVNGTHSGINFGTGPWSSDPSFAGLGRCGYFTSSTAKSATFTLPSGKFLKSIQISGDLAGTYTISDGMNTAKTGNVVKNTPATVTTGWTKAGTTVTINFSIGWDGAITAITY